MTVPDKNPDATIFTRRLATAKEVSELLRWPLTTLYEAARAGRVPGAIRRGRRHLFDVDKLEAWLDAGGDIERTNK